MAKCLSGILFKTFIVNLAYCIHTFDSHYRPVHTHADSTGSILWRDIAYAQSQVLQS